MDLLGQLVRSLGVGAREPKADDVASPAAIAESIRGLQACEPRVSKMAAKELADPEELHAAVARVYDTLRREGGKLPFSALVVDTGLPSAVVRAAVEILVDRGRLTRDAQSPLDVTQVKGFV